MKHQELDNLSFEDALQQLEAIVRDLEGGRIKLDDAVEAYEKAAVLKKLCEARLKAAQLKIEQIEKPQGSAELELKPFNEME